MKGRKRNMEWLYRILCLGLYDTLTHCPQEYDKPKTLKENKSNWHKGIEVPPLNDEGKSKYYLALLDGYDDYHPAKVAYNKDRWVIDLDKFPDYPIKVIWWIEMPEKTEEMKQFNKKD